MKLKSLLAAVVLAAPLAMTPGVAWAQDGEGEEATPTWDLSGEIGTALSGSAASLFAEPPQIHRAQILAFKIAAAGEEERTSRNTSVARPLEEGTV